MEPKNVNEKDYVIVPIDLFKNSEPIDVRVYCELDLLFEGRDNLEYIPHDAEFAEVCHISKEELRQSLQRLSELGWLDIENEEQSELVRQIVRFWHRNIYISYSSK